MDLEKCPLCGCSEIGEGSFVGYGGLINSKSLIPKTQEVVASVCTECGYIIAMRVLKPNKFKNSR
ncbi:transcription initiation factor TFIIIB [Romboutsia sp. 1001713B170131_170501_G6]|uniref:transcription initiation factor TFIIIB n=1 Tax=Romboutsia sp. 1001713B170131_170501_G6 TaxID=2787108 RepID=UPI0018ABB25A|nr:transcription initiation factor TFIIIB [Romboutsia sp. 1001713B170131_170501_G6]